MLFPVYATYYRLARLVLTDKVFPSSQHLPCSLVAWLKAFGPQYANPPLKIADIQYINGKPGDMASFGYTWIYPH